MPTVIANNYETHYELDDFTDPWVKDQETILIQHGLGRNARFWYHWVPLLARHYRVIRRDMRGHGQSADPGPHHGWSVDELLTDIKGFLDALESRSRPLCRRIDRGTAGHCLCGPLARTL